VGLCWNTFVHQRPFVCFFFMSFCFRCTILCTLLGVFFTRHHGNFTLYSNPHLQEYRNPIYVPKPIPTRHLGALFGFPSFCGFCCFVTLTLGFSRVLPALFCFNIFPPPSTGCRIDVCKSQIILTFQVLFLGGDPTTPTDCVFFSPPF